MAGTSTATRCGAFSMLWTVGDPLPSGAKVWLATGHTDMRKGISGLSLLVQEVLGRDPFCGHLFVFRGRRSDLVKIVWHGGQGGCLFMKRLDRGRFIWPSASDGAISISGYGDGGLGSALGNLRHRCAR